MGPSVSGSNAHFGFVRPFFECPIGRTNKAERPKKQAQQNLARSTIDLHVVYQVVILT